ncbi:MAG: hypothetical protein NUV97_03810 [archaeon]|nr:hypothetical protein [archaeon]MCR4323856.1 hypothetical protein [Nanoarchaeota archaeon]
MTTLDRIIEMQQKGMLDLDIVMQLKNEGISSKEINDSLNQARVKRAVSFPEDSSPYSQEQSDQQMQQSIMPPPTNQSPSGQYLASEGTQQYQGMAPPQMQPPQAPSPESYPPEQQYGDYYTQTPQAYQEQQDYYAPQTTDTEAITEIAEQVASEKISELKKKIGDIPSFKNEVHEKLSDLDERLKRIEHSIDKIYNSIIGKVGEFGESSAMIHQDLENLHGTMSKMMNPLMDNYHELRKIASHKEPVHHTIHHKEPEHHTTPTHHTSHHTVHKK